MKFKKNNFLKCNLKGRGKRSPVTFITVITTNTVIIKDSRNSVLKLFIYCNIFIVQMRKLGAEKGNNFLMVIELIHGRNGPEPGPPGSWVRVWSPSWEHRTSAMFLPNVCYS